MKPFDRRIQTIIGHLLDLQDIHRWEDENSAWPPRGETAVVTGGGTSDPTGTTAGARNTVDVDSLDRLATNILQQLESALHRRGWRRGPNGRLKHDPKTARPCDCCQNVPVHPAKPICPACWRYRQHHGFPCDDAVHAGRPQPPGDCECSSPLCTAEPHLQGEGGRCMNNRADDRRCCAACKNSVDRARRRQPATRRGTRGKPT